MPPGAMYSRPDPCPGKPCLAKSGAARAGEQPTAGAPWRIVLSDDTRRRLTGGDAPAGWLTLTTAAQRLGMSKSHVAYLVKTGKIRAMRTKVGKRPCWKIDVSTAERGPQSDLFEQITNAASGGS